MKLASASFRDSLIIDCYQGLSTSEGMQRPKWKGRFVQGDHTV